MKLTPKKLSSLTVTTISLLTLIILTSLSLFLYKNFYQTITQTNEILILREKVTIDTVNLEKFNVIINKLTEKITPDKLENIISPFR